MSVCRKIVVAAGIAGAVVLDIVVAAGIAGAVFILIAVVAGVRHRRRLLLFHCFCCC